MAGGERPVGVDIEPVGRRRVSLPSHQLSNETMTNEQAQSYCSERGLERPDFLTREELLVIFWQIMGNKKMTKPK